MGLVSLVPSGGKEDPTFWTISSNFLTNAENEGSIPGSGRIPGEGNGNPFWLSCLGNPMDLETPWKLERSLAGCSPCSNKRVEHDLMTQQQQNKCKHLFIFAFAV